MMILFYLADMAKIAILFCVIMGAFAGAYFLLAGWGRRKGDDE